ncbi:MAG TPA: DNA starvation/stationary phase protection protein [Actinobacteria bacterium]|jgi:starvation-inducible DNA-binding protein|nr:DNA starvation/stationary phase protection protein [Actinomycetota bacterium]
MEINIGITDEARKTITTNLGRLLADTYALYLKSQNYHWNVTGPMFTALHQMFETHYMELRDAVDAIAERIRSLGYPAPASFSEFTRLTGIPEGNSASDAMTMVRDLATGHEACARTARTAVEAAEAAGDVATADLATVRVDIHEKTAWMLRATAA